MAPVPHPESNPSAHPVGLYLYFKSSGEPQAVMRALRATDALLQADGWPAATFWRRHSGAVPGTWMSVHAPQPAERIDRLVAAFEDAARAAGLSCLIDGACHAERFEPCGEPVSLQPCA